jgi:hypothetical protein
MNVQVHLSPKAYLPKKKNDERDDLNSRRARRKT